MASFEERFSNYKPPALPKELSHLPDRISESFAGKTIFITGGSGFLGKVLIEKILRKCSDIERIYLLLRPKKGSNPKQRVETIFSSVVSFIKLNIKFLPITFKNLILIRQNLSLTISTFTLF